MGMVVCGGVFMCLLIGFGRGWGGFLCICCSWWWTVFVVVTMGD